jgi:hypothetical protein
MSWIEYKRSYTLSLIIIIIISAERRPQLDIGLPQSSPRRSVLRCTHPAASRDLHQIVDQRCVSRYAVAIRGLFRPDGRQSCALPIATRGLQYGRAISVNLMTLFDDPELSLMTITNFNSNKLFFVFYR